MSTRRIHIVPPRRRIAVVSLQGMTPGLVDFVPPVDPVPVPAQQSAQQLLYNVAPWVTTISAGVVLLAGLKYLTKGTR